MRWDSTAEIRSNSMHTSSDIIFFTLMCTNSIIARALYTLSFYVLPYAEMTVRSLVNVQQCKECIEISIVSTFKSQLELL